MPGKYLEYIKAGRFVVPVEITFLQAPITNELTGKEEFSTKWADRNDWREIKTLLKPGVEGVIKYNDTLIEKVPKSTQLSFGQEIGLGYAMAANKEKSPFFAVLDTKKNCWTDDEDEEVDENTGFQNSGGSFKSFLPTKLYVKVVIVKKTFSTSDDGRRIQKFMGGKSEDIRQYYKSTNQTIAVDSSTEIMPLSKNKNCTKHTYREPISHKAKTGTLDGKADNRDLAESPRKEHRSSIDSSLKDYTITKEKLNIGLTGILGNGRWPMISRTPSLSIKNYSPWKNIRNNVDGSYYEEKDEDDDQDDEDEDTKSYPEYKAPMVFLRNSVVDDDDDDSFILPDIPDSSVSMRDETLEKRYSSEEPSTKHRNPSTENYSAPLDFTNILRPTSSPTTISKSYNKQMDTNLPSINVSNQKRKNFLLDQNYNTAFSDALSLVDSDIRKEKKSRITSKKSKLIKDQPLSPEKSSSPARKLVPPSPSKPANKISKTIRTPRNKALKVPAYLKNQKQNGKVQKSPTKDNNLNNSLTRFRSLSPSSPIRSGFLISRELSPRPTPRPKREKRRKEIEIEESSNSSIDGVDPEMPVLQKMVYLTEPPAPYISLFRLPKIEPVISTRDELITQVITLESEHKEEEPSNFKPKGREKRKRKKKDCQTQTGSDRGDVIPADGSGTPIQSISESQLISAPLNLSTLSQELTSPLSSMLTIEAPKPTNNSFDNSTTIDSDDEDDEANLFSFEHLSKCCTPTTYQSRIDLPIHSTPAFHQLQLMSPIAPLASMMLPPVRRPPKTPKKNPAPPPVPVPSQTLQTQLSLNSGDIGEVQSMITTVDGTTQPSAMSTFQLLSNKHTLMAGFGLLNQLASKKLSAEQVGVRLGLQEERRERSISPDICLGPSKAIKPPEVIETKLRKRPGRKGKGRTVFEDNDISMLDRHGGEALFRELISRTDNNSFRYEPKGDDFDLSQNSICMVKIYPQYEQKSRTFKMHSKNISELSIEMLTGHFNTITTEIRGIFDGSIPSERHQLYLEGPKKRKDLKDLNVSAPFEHRHGTALMEMLMDLLLPNQKERPKWTDYINFVMLPESFIRIYSNVNEISNNRADTELRFGACYDGDPSHQ